MRTKDEIEGQVEDIDDNYAVVTDNLMSGVGGTEANKAFARKMQIQKETLQWVLGEKKNLL